MATTKTRNMLPACPTETPILVPEHFREPKEEEQQMDQIRLIIDSEYILTGTVTGKSSDTCLYSGQKNFVRVFKDAMRNEIALIRLKQGEQ